MLKEFKPELEAILDAGKTKPNTAPPKHDSEVVYEVVAKPNVPDVPSAEAEVLRRLSYLQLTCLAHRYLYYVENSAIISDAEYDRFEKELKDLREAFPNLWEKSEYRKHCPTETVGSELDESYPEAAVWLAQQKLVEYEDMRQYFSRAEDEDQDSDYESL